MAHGRLSRCSGFVDRLPVMPGSPIKHEKRRIVQAAILLALQEGDKTPEEMLAPAMRKQYDKAMEGDTQAATFLADRLDGKPAQQLQHTGEDGGPVLAKILREVVAPTASGPATPSTSPLEGSDNAE